MRRALTLTVIAVLTFADQLLKIAAEAKLAGNADYPRIEGFMALRYVQNTGAAFSMLSGKTTLLAVFTAAALAVGIAVLISGKIKDKLLYVSITLVVAGGMGNLYDRIFRGYVIDYIEVLFVRFAVFNFADCLVTIGAFLMAAYIIVDSVREARQKKRGVSID